MNGSVRRHGADDAPRGLRYTSDIVYYGGSMGAFASAKAYRALGGTGTIKIIEPLGAIGSVRAAGLVRLHQPPA